MSSPLGNSPGQKDWNKQTNKYKAEATSFNKRTHFAWLLPIITSQAWFDERVLFCSFVKSGLT
jgi:hypothetical protein